MLHKYNVYFTKRISITVACASIEFSINSFTTDDADVMTCVLLISLIVSNGNRFKDMIHKDMSSRHQEIAFKIHTGIKRKLIKVWFEFLKKRKRLITVSDITLSVNSI